MNKDIKITNNHLAYFQSLENLGIKNFFTFNNEKWGNMRISDANFNQKFDEISDTFEMSSHELIYLAAEQNNNVVILNESNLKIYRLFNKSPLSNEKRNIIALNTDSIITKLKIPVVITPADCAVIYIIGVDKKDNQKFMCFIHAGVFGTMLNIHTKVLDIAHTFYDFENKDLNIFVTPAVAGENYRKDKSEDVRGLIFTDPDWAEHVIDYEDKFGIKIITKIISDYTKAGVKNIEDSKMDSFTEASKGNLHSLTFYKSLGQESKNFIVGGVIN